METETKTATTPAFDASTELGQMCVQTEARLRFHPLAELFPLIDGQQFRELVEDVRAKGLLEGASLCQMRRTARSTWLMKSISSKRIVRVPARNNAGAITVAISGR
jgi:hypothetical protein